MVGIPNHKASVAKFTQTQCNPGKRAHERGVHHGTTIQIHNKTPETTFQHSLGKFLQSGTDLKRTLPLHPYMDRPACYPKQDGSCRIHRTLKLYLPRRFGVKLNEFADLTPRHGLQERDYFSVLDQNGSP